MQESRQMMRKEKKKRIGVTEGSGEWAYHRSEHRNVRAGLIITRFTFLRSLARTCAHVYNISRVAFFAVLCHCDRELPNSKKRRDLISVNTAHLLCAAVQLLCD